MADKTKLTVPRGRPPKGWKKRFLKALAATGNVSAACRHAEISRMAVYGRRGRDIEFARLWDDACEQSYDAMEFEARRRAVQGTDKPVYYLGKPVGTVKEYSDGLLMFMLKAKRPSQFREAPHDGPGSGTSLSASAATQGVPVTVVEVRIPHTAAIPDATHEQRGIDGPAA